jgi:flagella basal body P-ring formation protein FlgA
MVQKLASELITTNWSGASLVRVPRRARPFSESDLTDLLTAALQKDFVKDRGELQVHLGRPFTTITAPDEPLTVKVSNLPSAGICQNCVATCQLWNGHEFVGSWDLSLRAEIWRDVPIARTTLTRGSSVKDADVMMERRDILADHNYYLNFPTTDSTLEFADTVSAGMPILNHSVRVRPLIARGQLVEGVFQEGSLSISLKVESLEDGLLGQTVRVVNPKTKKELYGKVQNDSTVSISL